MKALYRTVVGAVCDSVVSVILKNQ